MKSGEQPGPDKLKGEIYKSLEDNKRLVMHLTGHIMQFWRMEQSWKSGKDQEW